MKKNARASLAALVLLLVTGPAGAEICAIDNVPAATLLIPYFEVEPSKKGRVNTVVSIQNTVAAPTIAHVTLWTDWAVPTLSFDVFLTGYDIQVIDLRDLFVAGELPQTAHAANDPDDTISPHGSEQFNNPQWDSAPDDPGGPRFDGCDQLLPPAPLQRALLDRVRNSHTGQDTGEGCVAENHGDGRARGYLTIDNATDCSLLFPGESGYFGADGVASDVNQLRGEYYITEKSGRGMAAGEAVAIEADSGFTGGAAYTFYGRYVDGMGTDRREPLGSFWFVRQPEALPFGKKRRSVVSDLLIWRDPRNGFLQRTYQCGTETPPWYPMNETQIVAFDERSGVAELCFPRQEGEDFIDPVCAPLATQRVRLGQGEWSAPVDPGWWALNLYPGITSFEGLVPLGMRQQSFVAAMHTVSRLRGINPGTVATSICDLGAAQRKRRPRR